MEGFMLEITGGILLAILILALLPWLLAGTAWVIGIFIAVAIAAAAIWAFWIGAQSLPGLIVELVLGVVLVDWVLSKMPRRPFGQPNLVVRLLTGWVKVLCAPVLAPVGYWRSVRDRRLQGHNVNAVAVTAGLTWSCFAGLFLSWLAISLPTLAVWSVLSALWDK
jgi:hypothetical protein